jgi:hypothetical protein
MSRGVIMLREMKSPFVAHETAAKSFSITRESEHTQSIPKIPPIKAAILVSPTFARQLPSLKNM